LKRVLVVGGTGLAGSAILRQAPNNFKLYCPSRQELDLMNASNVKKYLSLNCIDTVILAAAKVGGIIANSKSHWRFLADNLKIELSVIESSMQIGVPNLLFLSSSCAYPVMARQPMSEEQILEGKFEPTNEGYALAKVVGMRLCKAAFEEFNLNYFSLIPTNLYGQNDNFDPQTSHVPAALMLRFHEAKISRAGSVSIWGTGTPMREFMSVDDLASACWHFVGKPFGGQSINIGTGRETSIRQFAELMAKTVNFMGSLNFDSSKPDGAPRKILDISKAKQNGWTSTIELEEGLMRTYDWFLKAYSKGAVRGI